jgi:enterochelin esterase family protein
MKKMFLALVIFLMAISSSSAQRFADFIEYVNSLPAEERTPVIDSFMTAVEPAGFPYLTGDSANFIYRGDVANVRIAGDFNGWDPGFYFLANVSGTDFFYRSVVFELNARLDYKYVINNTEWILDPLNPNTCAGGYGPNSELAMPAYVQPWEIEEYPATPKGTIIEDQIASSHTNGTFQLRIYLPNGYDENLPGGYPVVYFQDGHEYISLGYADNVLDNMIDSGMCAPVIGVFVRPNNRNEEYAFSLRDKYRLFFVEELVPYIDSEYNTIADPRGRAVLGDSFGGNISALISYNHPDIFGNCGLHSGAFWPNDYEAYHLITEGEVKLIRWASVWGTYEGLWENMRALRDHLEENGYDLQWQELPEGHSWGLWRATIDELVPYFFPPGFMGIAEESIPGIFSFEVYPNPSHGKISCRLNATGPVMATLRLVSMSGHIVHETISSFENGTQIIEFELSGLSSGIYLLIIDTGDFRYSEEVLFFK